MDSITILLGALLGCTSLLSFLLYRRASKRIKNAEADKAESEARQAEFALYDRRITEMHTSLNVCNATIREQEELISQLNRAIADKTERIRSLTDQAYESEREANRINTLLHEAGCRITKLTEQRDSERLQKERYKAWHCRKGECDMRMPPNPGLAGRKFGDRISAVAEKIK